jgi:hypothetical protein
LEWDLPLLFETLQGVRGLHGGAHQLDGDLLVELGIVARGAVNRSQAAMPNNAFYFVGGLDEHRSGVDRDLLRASPRRLRGDFGSQQVQSGRRAFQQ